MKGRALVLLAVAAGSLAAQGVPAREKPADYPAHVRLAAFALAAEFLARSLPVQDQTLFLQDYLVVEIACFPADGPVKLSAGEFTLRLNGKKRVLLSQSPGMVAASLKYPDWERRPAIVAAGGIGDAGVIVGRPQRSERFPGDPRPSQERLPQPPRAPAPEDQSGAGRTPPEPPEELVTKAALAETPHRYPFAGALYFPYRGKLKSIKSVELLYQSESGAIAIRLP
jgi:hypothetical protein